MVETGLKLASMTKPVSKQKIILVIFLSFTSGALLLWGLNTVLQPHQPSPFDRNQDAALSYSEFSIAMHLLFKKLDTDGDGKVSLEEFSAAKEAGKFSLKHGITMAFRFNEIDKDGDNAISREEFLADSHLKPYFAIFDRDGDGFIRRGESDVAMMKYLFP